MQVFETGETDDGEPFLVREMLHGESLSARISAAGRLPVAEAARLVVQALRGLRRAHAGGIVHRDLKPENIFVVRKANGALQPKLVDFGIAKLAMHGPDERITSHGVVLGSPAYMAPEQACGLDDVDHRADIWSAISMRLRFSRTRFNSPATSCSFALRNAVPLPFVSVTHPSMSPALSSRATVRT